MQRLELISVSLNHTTLIEASAGTGKTYTIAALYLRMIVELGLSVEQILVVTYTKAATSELKLRIRARLVDFSRALKTKETEDPFAEQLIKRCADHDVAYQRVQQAILSFDLCSIFTIHGFCQRILGDQAYESSMPFKMDLLEDESELLQQVVDDYWRSHIQNESDAMVNYLRGHSVSPESLAQTIKPHLHKPYLRVVGGDSDVDLSTVEDHYLEVFKRVRECWVSSANEIEQLLLTSTELNRNSYRVKSIPKWIEAMDRLLSEIPGPWFDAFIKFTQAKIDGATKKNCKAPEHAFFSHCSELHELRIRLDEALEGYFSALNRKLLEFSNSELARRKRALRQQSYDDLLLNLYYRVVQEQGSGGQSIKSRYSAALIDEFQDTDPIQYEIFSSLFSDSETPLFLVGDPKQAIYSFRGADLFAYLLAKKDSQNSYTLDVNWRSIPGLINSTNRLFNLSGRPFLFEEIPFIESLPSLTIDKEIVDSDFTHAPFKLGLVPAQTKVEASWAAANWTALEVCRLLNGSVTLGDQLVAADDIAVLVRTNRQAEQISEALADLGVHSVINSQQSVFHSQEAIELSQVMQAVLDPTHQGRLNAALSSSLIGWKSNQLDTLSVDDSALDEVIEQFQTYHQIWQEQGFIRMFRQFMKQQALTDQLLGMPSGERRLTNVLHLTELLHSHDRSNKPGMEGLWKWLSRKINSEHLEGEAQQLRLESDESLVQIVTVHRSKGLQYPIVFVPYTWESAISGAQASEQFSFHDPAFDYQATLDLGSDNREINKKHYTLEQMSEGLRLLYVALTRAEYRCYAFWSNCKNASTSALSWLLYGQLSADSLNPIADLDKWFKGLDVEQMMHKLGALANAGDHNEFEVFEVETDPYTLKETAVNRDLRPSDLLQARSLKRKLSAGKQVSSFSGMVRHKSSEHPDHDEERMHGGPLIPLAWKPEPDIHGFPRGANAGSCIHHVFEHIKFSAVEHQSLLDLVDQSLGLYGIDPSWTETIAVMVMNVLETVLDREHGVQLKAVNSERSWVEMEFYFPVQNLSVDKLRNTLIDHGFVDSRDLELALSRLSFSKMQGYMKGFVDLVFEIKGKFYIVDYKSNWMGANAEDYNHANQKLVIAEDFYFLQYLLYTVALHRYLKLKKCDYDYETHFGAVYYLFVRGMHPLSGPDRGVFRDRPSTALIEALDRLFEQG